MRDDLGIWMLLCMVLGVGYALTVVGMHKAYHSRKVYGLIVVTELSVLYGLANGMVLIITGAWYLWRYFALAFITIGVPLAIVIMLAATAAAEEEHAEIERITRDRVVQLRAAGLRSGHSQDDVRSN